MRDLWNGIPRILAGVLLTSWGNSATASDPARSGGDRPNIVYLLADDLGYGDVSALNPSGKIATPHMDRIAAEGMTFTDAHAGSSVCTPTRYGILTGRYCWRSRLTSGVLGGYSTHLIEPDRMTVADLLQARGYRTACVGKWHLGMDWRLQDGGTADDQGQFANGYADAWKVDYDAAIRNGPRALGFDAFFGISASLDMPPYVFLRDDRAERVPTVEKTWIRTGPAADDFEAVDVLPRITDETVRYLDDRAGDAAPFFLYVPLTAPHTPIVPTEPYRGVSAINAYADFVVQVDATVGRILDALDRNHLSDRTLLIVTSDNGCSPQANFEELAAHGHHPSHTFRGHKADIYEGGHRIPFLVRWPGRVQAGTRYDHPICLTDLMATCAEIVGATLPANAGEDSVSLLPALLGEVADAPIREATVHHSINGSFAIRQGPWKLCLCPDSGGWSAPRPGSDQAAGLPPVQLFNLSRDIGERENLADTHPEIVERLSTLLEDYVARGRSTPGEAQANDSAVSIRRSAVR